MHQFTEPRILTESSEGRIICVLVADTSGSMAPCAHKLQQAIVDLVDTINSDDFYRSLIDLCLITYNDEARVVQPFAPAHAFKPPHEIECRGTTSTHQAIRLAIDKVNERKAEYQANGVPYRQPWIWLFTDGGSNDDDNGSFDELLQMQRAGRLSFYGVGIGPEAEASELKGMHKSNIMLRVSRENFKAAFEFLSASISQASKSKPGEKITMTVPPQIIIE